MRQSFLPLPRDVEAGLLRAAADVHPREACGLLAGRRLVVLENVLDDPAAREAFTVDPDALAPVVAALGGWGEVTAVWHSHSVRADGSGGHAHPSVVDEAAHPVGKVLIIVADGGVYAWEHEQESGSGR